LAFFVSPLLIRSMLSLTQIFGSRPRHSTTGRRTAPIGESSLFPKSFGHSAGLLKAPRLIRRMQSLTQIFGSIIRHSPTAIGESFSLFQIFRSFSTLLKAPLFDPEYAEFDPNIRLPFLEPSISSKSFGHSAHSSTNPCLIRSMQSLTQIFGSHFYPSSVFPKSFGHSAHSSTNPSPRQSKLCHPSPQIPGEKGFKHHPLEERPEANDDTNIASE
jgi:hypothetical protein